MNKLWDDLKDNMKEWGASAVEKAEEIRVLTDGYFDISIGEVVNVWKELLLENENGFLFSEIPNDIFTAVLAEIELIDLEEDVIEERRVDVINNFDNVIDYEIKTNPDQSKYLKIQHTNLF